MTCPICKALKEESLHEDDLIKILETKSLKGHRRRIMVVTKEHMRVAPSWLDSHMLDRLEEVGRRVFGYTYKFIIMSPLFGSVKDHAHYVASDLEPDCEDFHQILGTPWIRVVEVRLWD